MFLFPKKKRCVHCWKKKKIAEFVWTEPGKSTPQNSWCRGCRSKNLRFRNA